MPAIVESSQPRRLQYPFEFVSCCKRDDSILPSITEYIRIPNKSPAFDPEWHSHGYMEQAMTRYAQWARRQPLKGMKLTSLDCSETKVADLKPLQGMALVTLIVWVMLRRQGDSLV